jgi:hypothetical protein
MVLKPSVIRSYSIGRVMARGLHERTEMLSPALDGELEAVNGSANKPFIINDILRMAGGSFAGQIVIL